MRKNSLLLLFLGTLILSCSSSSTLKKQENTKEINADTSNVPLIDQLRKYSGIYIRGSGATAQVFLRGISSINNPKEVLFIVNGTQVGNFSRASAGLNPQEIKRIEVLKNPTDLGTYGFMGAGGVILITTQ